jgi:hypothetical protein
VYRRLADIYDTNPKNASSALECYARLKNIYMKHLGHLDSRTREAIG